MTSRMDKVCSIPWCQATGTNLTFATFPSQEISQLQWLTILELADTWRYIPHEDIAKYLICSLHFDSGGALRRRAVSHPQTSMNTTTSNYITSQPSIVNQFNSQQVSTGSKRTRIKALSTPMNTFHRPTPRTRESFPLGKKVEVIRALESGMKQSQVSALMNIHKSSVHLIWKFRETILKAFSSNGPMRKKLRKSRFEEVDVALYKWYTKVTTQSDITITSKLLQKMAESFTAELKIPSSEFLCSSGWVERFKQRHGIRLDSNKKNKSNLNASLGAAEEAEDLNSNDDDKCSADQFVSFEHLIPKTEVIENCDSDSSPTVSTTEFYQTSNILDDYESNDDPLAFIKEEGDMEDEQYKEEGEEEYYDEGNSNNSPTSSVLPSEEQVTPLPNIMTAMEIHKGSSSSITSCNDNNNMTSNSNLLEVTEDWLKNTWSILREDYKPSDIFAAVEMGLLYRIKPLDAFDITHHSHYTKNNARQYFNNTYNLGQERISILLCTNSTGTEKKKLLVVGQEKKPSSLTSILTSSDFSCLPVDYQATSDKTSWLTEYNFLQWIFSWDSKLKETENDRKILLVLNECSIHSESIIDSITLNNIKVVLIPQNITMNLQPIEQGILQNFKLYYRRLLLERLIFNHEQKKVHKNVHISLFDAFSMLNTAWNEVTAENITNAFKMSCVVSSLQPEDDKLFKGYSTLKYTNPFGNLNCQHVIQKAMNIGLIPQTKDWKLQDYADVDDIKIINSVQSTNNQHQVATVDLQRILKLSPFEIQTYLDDIKIWSMNRNGSKCPQSVHDAISRIESFTYNH